MTLGTPAPAPPGFLAFCARTPDECGLAGTTDDKGRPLSANELSRVLYARYYWPLVFSSGDQALPPIPTAGADVSTVPSADRARRDVDDREAIFRASDTSDSAAPTLPPIVRPLATTSDLLAELDRVNLRINRAIRYESDKNLFGDEDHWHLALGPDGTGAGDCKDYVLEKRRALIAEGVPAADLSIALVETASHESHAILLASTDRGELVLDSLSSWIKPWRKVSYAWIERQAPGQEFQWVSIS